MKMFITSFKISVSVILISLLVNCASTSLDSVESVESVDSPVALESIVANEENRVVVTGSRLQRSDIESDIPDELRAEKQKNNNKTTSWKPAKQAANNAVIKVGDEEEIEPQALDISIQIDGFRARVVIDSFYKNPHDRNLEGSFKFRLPNNAVPYFFAFGESINYLDKNLKQPVQMENNERTSGRLNPDRIMSERASQWIDPKEAIMVSKEKAAFAYNDTVARQVDPALLEWAGAGIFSAKIFPLQAKKSHRVVLGYDLDLRRVGQDLLLDLPLTDKAIQKRVHIIINNKNNNIIQLNRIVNNEIKATILVGNDKDNQAVIQETIEGTLLNGVRIRIKDSVDSTLIGRDEVGRFFAKRYQVNLPMSEIKSQQRAIFVIDTSLSSSSDKFHLWVKLISEILENNKQDIKEFALVSFNTDTKWWNKSFVANNSHQRSRLKRYLNQLILEGATDLANVLQQVATPDWLDQSNHTASDAYDVFLLSDGASTWGEKDPYFLSESMKSASLNRIFTYRMGVSGENAELLTHLTREVGGATYELTDEGGLSKLSMAHRMAPWNIDSITAKGTNDVLIAGRPNSIYPGQLLTLSGRVLSKSAEFSSSLNLKVSRDSEVKIIKIPLNSILKSNLTARIYGQIAVNQLESIITLERQVASAYANYFRVPGQSSSLLMLESEEDYQRYNIKPAEDAYVVQSQLVKSIFKRRTDGFAQTLSDPKKRFVDQLEKLEKMKFISFALPDAIALLIKDMPTSIFDLPHQSKASKKFDIDNIPENYLNELKKQNVHYDSVQNEANRRLAEYGASDALKVMGSLVEQAPGDVAIIRDVAFAAENWGLPLQAFLLHLKVAELRPYEPHSYTYLAKLAQQLGKYDLALVYFEIGLASNWSNRFGDYGLIHKIDYVNFLRKSLKSNDSFFARDYAQMKLKRLKNEINVLGSELIVAISWNTDRTDIDLHIVEPSGEECYYKHQKTKSGGYITQDVTQGYGPEMYVNKDAPKGNYDILVNYFSTDQNKLGLKTKVLVRTIRNWGTENEQEEVQTVVLTSSKEKQRIKNIQL